MGWIEGDSGLFDTGFNEPLQFALDVAHEGSWTLGPNFEAPYDILTGEMTIQEIADGDIITPWCDFTYSLTGQASNAAGCDTCDFVFDIEFYVLDYDEDPDDEEDMDDMEDGPMQARLIEQCFTPDLPAHQEIRRLGFSFVEQTIYFNYYNSGLWIPWYDASQNVNEVMFSWETQVGFYGFPDDN